MAEGPIKLDLDASKIAQELANLTQQVDRLNQSLGQTREQFDITMHIRQGDLSGVRELYRLQRGVGGVGPTPGGFFTSIGDTGAARRGPLPTLPEDPAIARAQAQTLLRNTFRQEQIILAQQASQRGPLLQGLQEQTQLSAIAGGLLTGQIPLRGPGPAIESAHSILQASQAFTRQGRLQQLQQQTQLSAIAGGMLTGQIPTAGPGAALSSAHSILQASQAFAHQQRLQQMQQQSQLGSIVAAMMTGQIPIPGVPGGGLPGGIGVSGAASLVGNAAMFGPVVPNAPPTAAQIRAAASLIGNTRIMGGGAPFGSQAAMWSQLSGAYFGGMPRPQTAAQQAWSLMGNPAMMSGTHQAHVLNQLASTYFQPPLQPFAGTPAQQAFGLVGNQAMFGPAAAAYGGGMMPPPSGPYSAWPGTFGQRMLGYAGQMLPQAAHAGISTIGNLGATLAGGAANFIGRAAPLALGYTAYQFLSQAMQTYEVRSRGVLQVGSMLDGQYKEIDTTLQGLREQYHILAQEGVAAMMALGRATTSMAGLGPNMRTARAYGIAPQAMGEWQAAMTTLSGTTVPLARISMGMREEAIGRGQRVLPPERFLEESARIAAIGGAAAPAMPQEYYDRMQIFMGQIGGTRMGLNAGEAAQLYAQGLAQPKGTLGDVMSERAITELAKKTPILQLPIGPNGETMELNIAGNYWDRKIAREQAFQLPQVQQALAEQVGTLSGGNAGLQGFWQQQLFGTQTAFQARLQGERIQGIARTPGGIPATLTEPVSMPVVEATEAARLRQQEEDEAARKGFDLRKRAAEAQAAAETQIIANMENTGNAFVTAITKSTEAIERQEGVIRAFTTFMEEILPGLTPWVQYAPGGSIIRNVAPDLIPSLPGGSPNQPRKPGP